MVLLLSIIGCNGNSESTDSPVAIRETTEQTSVTETPDAKKTSIRFTDQAAEWGVDFVPRTGREQNHFTILESLGTGVAITDVDGDERPDIVAAGGGTFDEAAQPIGFPCGVFRQQPDRHFQNVTPQSVVDSQQAYTHGVVTADWNNDGFEDIVVTGYQSVRLFENAGDGTFLDVTTRAGLKQDSWSTSAAFLDADGDGHLELFVTNYVDWFPDPERECIVQGHRDVCPPGEFQAQQDHLYRNEGDGRMTEIAAEVGMTEAGKGLAVIAGDIDLDGDTDVYVANDTTANLLYLNDGRGTFEERGLISGCALGATAEAEGSMGVDFADFDQDGRPDIWVSNYENQSFAMYQSRGPAIFQHVSRITGISAVGQLYVGFGTVAFDADLDGDQDIFAANGHVMYASGKAPPDQQPLVYENMDGRVFRNVAEDTGEYGRKAHMGRGVAAGDLDGDGRIDLVVAHSNAPLAVLKNTSKTSGSFVRLKLHGRGTNRSAIGTTITTASGDQLRLSTSGGSYLSGSHKVLHFFLPRTSSSTRLKIKWPNGILQNRDCPEIDLNHVVQPPGMN